MDNQNKLISKKKPAYPITDALFKYLRRHGRTIKIPIFYDDLLRFQGSVSVYDKNGKDTLWVSVYYSEFETEEIHHSLKKCIRYYTLMVQNPYCLI